MWTGAGLTAVETKETTVQRIFSSFDDHWKIILKGPSVAPGLSAMGSDQLALLKSRMREKLPADSAGKIIYSARTNAVKGWVGK